MLSSKKNVFLAFSVLSLMMSACGKDEPKQAPGTNPKVGTPTSASAPEAPAKPPADPLSVPPTVDAKTGEIKDGTGWKAVAAGNEVWMARLVSLDKTVVSALQRQDKTFSEKDNLVQILKQITLGADGKPIANQHGGAVEFLDERSDKPIVAGSKKPRFSLTYTAAPAMTAIKYDYDLLFQDDKAQPLKVGVLTLARKDANAGPYEPTITALCAAPGVNLKPVCEVKLAAGKFDQLILLPGAVKENQAILEEERKSDLQKAQEKVAKARDSLTAALGDLDNAVKAKAKDEGNIARISAENIALKKQVEDAMKAAGQAQVALNAAQEAVKVAENKLKTVNEALTKATADLALAKKNLDEKNLRIAELETQVTTLTQEGKKAKEEVARVQQNLTAALASLEAAKASVNKAENDVKAASKPLPVPQKDTPPPKEDNKPNESMS